MHQNGGNLSDIWFFLKMKEENKINTWAVYVSPTEENTGCEISEIFFFYWFHICRR